MSALLQNISSMLAFQLILAMTLGGFIGWERKHWKKPAGGRTLMLISLGSALFTIISKEAAFAFGSQASVDPTRIASNILTGIGFIGAGVILHQGARVAGITTAAAVWVSAAVGMAVALEFYGLAILTTILTIVGLNLFYLIRLVRARLTKQEFTHDEENEDW